MIPVTKPYMPSREKLDHYIDGIYNRNWLTNNGHLVKELTKRLEAYLNVENLLLVSNGTLALQIAYRALGISGQFEKKTDAITTPFTFVATASSLKWDGVQPVFADIDSETWCLDPTKIEAAITSHTRAIVPVHVFGNACDVEAIGTIAEAHHLKVVYDAAHAFGVTFRGKSLLEYGDAATLSFHATKLFHTAEGGAIIFKRKEDLEIAKKMINFGITGPETIEELGINAKMNELQAALGLCLLDEMEDNMRGRKNVWNAYEADLINHVQLQKRNPHASNNYAYFPILLENEGQVISAMKNLEKEDIFARRYFYPSLNRVSHIFGTCKTSVSDKIDNRILCLPIFHNLQGSDVKKISDIVKQCDHT